MRSATDERSESVDSISESPPRLNEWPLVGSTLSVVRDPIGFFDRVAEHGDVVRYQLFGSDVTMVLHPDHIERLLVTESESVRKLRLGEYRDNEFAPNGVLFTEGKQWRNQRTLLQNAFTPDRIQHYGTTMTDVAAQQAESWAEGEEVAIDRQFSRMTLSILAKTLFDIDIEERRSSGSRGAVITEVAHAINEQSDPSNLWAVAPSWIPSPTQRRYDRAMAAFERLIDALVEERAGNESDSEDLLSLLLTAETGGYRHSERELRDQLLTFLFAGHETTSLALTYTILLLTQHPAVTSRLREEWDEELGDGDPAPSDVPDLTYTDCVVRESLRLYPPAYALFRAATEDIYLDDYVIPKGTNITIPQYRVHRDPRFYEAPETFDPDRWVDPPERPEYAYFPFGGGPRHCIGMRFAMLELKLLVPTILRRVRFELLSDPDPDLAPRATLHPAENVRTRVQTTSSRR